MVIVANVGCSRVLARCFDGTELVMMIYIVYANCVDVG